MAQPFETPEILYLICEQLPRPDLARLLTTSRLFFYCAVPFLWGQLPYSAPIILMKLLPDSDTHLNRLLKNKFIKNLKPLDGKSLMRFNLYAPYVKGLAEGFGLDPIWKKLFKLTDARPLLPNLEVLKFPITSRFQDLASYLAVCLTPALVEIDYSPEAHPFVESQQLCDFMSTVVKRCPNVRTLKLGHVARGITIEPVHAGELAVLFSRLQNLRVLTFDLVALDPKVLLSLASLPNLESLTLNEMPNTSRSRGHLEDHWKRIDFSVPRDSFPELQHLGIDPCFELGMMTRIWNVIPFVQHLTSVSLRVEYLPVTEVQFHDFLRLVCKSSPFISALSLNVSHNNYIAFLSPGIINLLARLPLRYLMLSRGGYYAISDIPPWDSEQFALAFPKMEYLHICGYSLTFKDLIFIAKHMFQLRQLVARMEISRAWPSMNELSLLALTPSTSQLYFHLQLFYADLKGQFPLMFYGLPTEEAEVIAACLHALWPKGVICGSDGQPDEDGTDEVNAALRLLRETGGHGDWDKIMLLKHRPVHVLPWLQKYYV